MSLLVEAYAGLPLGAVDASVIAVAERLGITEVATLDRRHFTVVRPWHTTALVLLLRHPELRWLPTSWARERAPGQPRGPIPGPVRRCEASRHQRCVATSNSSARSHSMKY
ncbi:hypothetical protein OG589_39230 [Sphaerisporangium sp. NBC_01403]